MRLSLPVRPPGPVPGRLPRPMGLALVVLGLAISALVAWAAFPSLSALGAGRNTVQAAGADAGLGREGPQFGVATLAPDAPAATPSASWSGFRGDARTGIAPPQPNLARAFGPAGPKKLWEIALGEGHAGPCVFGGRVFLLDYDPRLGDVVRCHDLATGREVWRFAYPVRTKRNHGMSRTVPVTDGKVVVTLGPKAHVACLDAKTGKLLWSKDLVREWGTTVPDWYAGQCPLIDRGCAIIAPAGSALLVALDLTTGEVRWQSPNPAKWRMTHASITPLGGSPGSADAFLYAASGGLACVSASDGRPLWSTDQWKIKIATVPSPVPLGDGRILLSGGYGAGAALLELDKDAQPRITRRLEPAVFGATQQTPIVFGEHIYGVRPDGRLCCLDLQGNLKWASTGDSRFGLGPFLVAGQTIYALDDQGYLSLIDADPAGFKLLGKTRILAGPDAWGPMALVDGKLLARDLNTLVCLDVSAP